MRVDFYISASEQNKFASDVAAVIRNVDTGSKKATIQACQEILDESLKQVPRETGALAETAYYEVNRRPGLKSYQYEGIVGYAGIGSSGSSHDKVNPSTGARVSSYAVVVHEDPYPLHIQGKFKFLEDPVRAYSKKFKRVAETHWRWAIETSKAGGVSYIPVKE